jgi:50S ribosomal subunit-associated GTPase HflX
MSSIVSVIIISTCILIILNERRNAQERMEKFKERMKEFKINNEKRLFIINKIDEIPELSYYEAAQLKKKLGTIYLQWDEN